MNEKHLLFPASCVGKTLMIQKKWDNLKCTDCGCKLKLIYGDEFESVKLCQECGKKHLLIKKLRKDGLNDRKIKQIS